MPALYLANKSVMALYGGGQMTGETDNIMCKGQIRLMLQFEVPALYLANKSVIALYRGGQMTGETDSIMRR